MTKTTAQFRWMGAQAPQYALATHQFTITGSVENLNAYQGSADASVTAAAMQPRFFEKRISGNTGNVVGTHTPVPTGVQFEVANQSSEFDWDDVNERWVANVAISFSLNTYAEAQRHYYTGWATATSEAQEIETTHTTQPGGAGVALSNTPPAP